MKPNQRQKNPKLHRLNIAVVTIPWSGSRKQHEKTTEPPICTYYSKCTQLYIPHQTQCICVDAFISAADGGLVQMPTCDWRNDENALLMR